MLLNYKLVNRCIEFFAFALLYIFLEQKNVYFILLAEMTSFFFFAFIGLCNKVVVNESA